MAINKKFGLLFVGVTAALALSACNNVVAVSGYPKGNFTYNGKELILQKASSFCFDKDVRLTLPMGVITFTHGFEIVAVDPITINLANGDTLAPKFTNQECTVAAPAPTATLASQQQVTPVVSQTGVVSQTAVPASSFVGLDYQDDGKECRNMSIDVQKTWTNCWFQMLQAKVTTPEVAVPAIQQLCAAVKCTSWEAPVVAVPNNLYAGAWCPAGGNRDSIADAANPLGGQPGKEWMNNLFLIEAGTGGPDRVVQSNDPKQPCWVWVRK